MFSGMNMKFKIRKQKGKKIWELIETNKVVEVFDDKEEANEFLKQLNSKRFIPASISFNSVARQSGSYTTYIVIPKPLVEDIAIFPGDTLNVSLNISVDKKFIKRAMEEEG